ncbi:MAG: hypothetical protein EOO77_16935 [Oxalobacteraceae bacterium]|nr:MAG: hypothetical protein EOO77_16935 [Oxalobacteraceae bacterium]
MTALRDWLPLLDHSCPLPRVMWTPVGPITTVHQLSTPDFEVVDDWLVQRIGPLGEQWNKAPTLRMNLGGPPGIWQDYSVADPDVGFEFKMVWG